MVSLQEKILLTERGQKWLSQFPGKERVTALRLARSLTLVSHSSFERSTRRLILKTAASVGSTVALFAAREFLGNTRPIFENALSESSRVSNIDSTPSGNDLGSEARVAATIRSMSRANCQLLNHPNIGIMRASKCKAIILVDDLVGTGDRIKEYLEPFWANRSIRSWWSRHNIHFFVICFAATEEGGDLIRKLKCSPTVIYNRVCPSVRSLPWSQQLKSEVLDLCNSYGSTTSEPHFTLGYKDSAATLVFEHGCPDNVPAVLWAPSTKRNPWEPLFPARTVYPLEASAFPPEIVRRDPLTLLIEAGQQRLAGRIQLPVSVSRDTLLVLAYAEKGIRSTGALSFATGMDEDNCGNLLQSCVSWGFLTTRFRLTRAGLAELEAARRNHPTSGQVASIGKDDYYPRLLRKAT